MIDRRPVFWDTSALVFLCVYDRSKSPRFQQLSRQFPRKVAWWSTRVEMASAIARLRRTGEIADGDVAKGLARADLLQRSWSEIMPEDELRAQAMDLLKQTHFGLRAADALQLAAALAMCSGRAQDRVFVCCDGPLADAAAFKGFSVYR